MDEQELELCLQPVMQFSRTHMAALVINQSGNSLLDAEFGSATCISVSGRFFLITAGHNVQDVQPDRIKIVSHVYRDTRPIVIWGLNEKTEPAGPDALDVGWIEIDADSAGDSQLEPISLQDLLPFHSLNSNSTYMISGIPAVTVELKYPDSTLNPYHNFAEPNITTPDSDVDLKFNYPVRGIRGAQIVATPHPRGISGGPIWLVKGYESNLVWRTDCKLIGIFRSFSERRREVYGVKIHHWLQLLRDDIPEVRNAIDPMLTHDNPGCTTDARVVPGGSK